MTTNNNDKLDYLIALAMLDSEENDLNSLVSPESDIEFDRSYYKKRSSYIRKYKRRESARILKSFGLRVAVFTVLTAFSAVVLIGCVPKLNETAYNSVSKWYNEYVTEKYGPSNTNTNPLYSNLGSHPPEHIKDIVAPHFLPDGLIENIIHSDRNNNHINYYQSEKLVLSFLQSTLDEREVTFDSTNSVYYNVNISGISGIAVENDDNHSIYLYWSDGCYFYELSSTEYSIGSLIRIAESVK